MKTHLFFKGPTGSVKLQEQRGTSDTQVREIKTWLCHPSALVGVQVTATECVRAVWRCELKKNIEEDRKKSLLFPQLNQQKINFNMLKQNKSVSVLNMCISNAQKWGYFVW